MGGDRGTTEDSGTATGGDTDSSSDAQSRSHRNEPENESAPPQSTESNRSHPPTWDSHPRRDRSDAHETALACLEAGITASLPETLVESVVTLSDDTLAIGDEATYDLDTYDRLVILGGGKASGGLAMALESLLGDRIDEGVVVSTDDPNLDHVRGYTGDHPNPSDRNVAGTERVLEIASDADEGTLILAPITGGASALLCAPADGLSLSDVQATTDALLESGAAIDEINAVRKHVSAIKGGHLARVASPATVATLAISDVVGDDPSVIGSGPTVPDRSTFADALDVLDRYDIRESVPDPVVDRLERGAADEIEDTPDESSSAFDRTGYHLLANTRTALEAASEVATTHGYDPLLLSSRVRGEAREAGQIHAAIAEEMVVGGDPISPPAVVLSGGEVTVTVRGDGTGGPNQELALAAAIEFADHGTPAVLASVDTDGVDGPTDACGAIVDDETLADTDLRTARDALDDNDAYGFLSDLDAVLETGYTGTNVNDLRVIVVNGE